MKQKFKIPISFLWPLFLIFAVLSSCTTSDWPQFRGPGSNMVIEGDLPTEWSDSLNMKWSYNLEGESWSSPIAVGNKVFVSSVVLVKEAPKKETEQVQDPQGQAPQQQEEDKSYLEAVYRWQVACVDAGTGNELWKKVAFEGNPRTKKHARNNYACETPVSDGKRIYVYFGMVGVYCFDLAGNPVWEKDLGAYETLNGWGTGSSPVIHNGILYILVDNEVNSFLVALDAATGEEKWKVDREEKTTYSTPVIWENSVRTELVTLGNKARAYDPETGELLWELTTDGEYAIPSPVFDAEKIYFGKAGRRDPATFFAVKAGAEGDISLADGESTNNGVAWSNKETGIANPSPLLHNGLIYILASQGGKVTCVDAATGETVYSKKVDKAGACWASPWINNDKLFFLDDKGVTHVLKAGREFEVLSQNSIGDTFWASVVPVKNTYIFKGVEKMYCVGQ